MNSWMTDYITNHKKNQSRYEIDNYLIKSGYDPQEIEETWLKIEYKPASPKKSRLIIITDFVFKVAAILYATSLISFLIVFPKGEVSFFTILETLISVGVILTAVGLRATRPAIATLLLLLIYLLVSIPNSDKSAILISSTPLILVISWAHIVINITNVAKNTTEKGIKVD